MTNVDKEDKQQKKEHIVITFNYDNTLEPTKSLKVRETSVNKIVDITDGYNMSELLCKCPDFIPIFDYIENGTLPQDDKAARKLIFESEQFVIDDSILYHIFHPRTNSLDQTFPVVKQLCIPRSLREQLMISYPVSYTHLTLPTKRIV